MRRTCVQALLCVSVSLCLTSSAVFTQTAPASADPVMRAMVDELQRSVSELQFKDLDKPYFISYGIEDGGVIIHELGTARMGNSPKTSVLNKYCQAHDVKNLFVTDAASFVTGLTMAVDGGLVAQ